MLANKDKDQNIGDFGLKRPPLYDHRSLFVLYRRNKKYRKILKAVYIRFLIYTYLAEYLALFDP